jgi:predicted dehydrogenase
MSHPITRRDFIKTATVSVAAAAAGPAIAQSGSPNEKLDIAIIGLGGQGNYSYQNVRKENVVAVADVDSVRAGKAFERFDKKHRFADYRRMLDKHHKNIDAVVVATPDHTHFHPSYMAMDMGKHLYLEKPMAHNVWEIRKLTELAERNGLATQLGMQRHTKDNMHRVTELIQAKAIGDVTEVHCWVDSDRGMYRPDPAPNGVPETLDYDLWLGPVEHKPYAPNVTPYGWRFMWDFGTGEAGNWGCHNLDIPYSALEMDYPTSAAATGPEPHPEMTTKDMHSWFDFPAKGDRKAFKLHWYQAKGGPAILKELGLTAGGNNLFIGTKGMLLCGFDHRILYQKDSGGKWIVKHTHEDEMGFPMPKQTVPDSPGFHNEFILACKGQGPAPTCNFGYSGPLSETVLLANAAFRTHSSFKWDHKTMTCVNSPAAQAHIKPTYKKGWEIA